MARRASEALGLCDSGSDDNLSRNDNAVKKVDNLKGRPELDTGLYIPSDNCNPDVRVGLGEYRHYGRLHFPFVYARLGGGYRNIVAVVLRLSVQMDTKGSAKAVQRQKQRLNNRETVGLPFRLRKNALYLFYLYNYIIIYYCTRIPCRRNTDSVQAEHGFSVSDTQKLPSVLYSIKEKCYMFLILFKKK